jgi:tRNA(adenine34) deaminase
VSRDAVRFLKHDWQGQSLMFIGQQDPVLGEPVMRQLQQHIRACPEPILLPHAGHFVQEHGREIASQALQTFFNLSN